jgi:hypothetical protein
MEAAPAQHGQHTIPRPFCGNLHIAIYRHQVAAASHIFVTAKKQSAESLPPAERFTSAKKPQFLDRKANKYLGRHAVILSHVQQPRRPPDSRKRVTVPGGYPQPRQICPKMEFSRPESGARRLRST